MLSVIKGIQKKGGRDIVSIDLRGLENAVTKYFIICSGNSKTQVGAIADAVKETVKEDTLTGPFHREGDQNAQWVLIDYIDVIVHIFQEETRTFYNLTALWADGKVKNIDDV